MKKKIQAQAEPIGNLFGGQAQGSLVDMVNNLPPTLTHKRPRKIRVLSPDGFDIMYDGTWNSVEEAQAACKAWAERFEGQGYYSTADRTRIAIADIPSACTLVYMNGDPIKL